ncbi:Molybdopterin biosynthesis protein MoeA [hydrothermal vent metagenome]|uniref:Molybdopterin biosynthesis protein MoeA n=1 Tax=hydrothermal vent metagenome TaxID=652676 RepID=A0A1W1D1X7_9ZZZZ
MASSILEALEIIAKEVNPISIEILPIESCVGRIIAEDISAFFDLPRFDNSAMDGYAVKVSDANKAVRCDEVIYAGDNPSMTLEESFAIKIMTGAPIPKGCEAIVPSENVSTKNDLILLPSNIQMQGFIRKAGEDIRKGTVFLQKGTEINAYTIASLASQGISHISVYREIKVVIFATGDELRPHYENIESYQLYNSNSPMFLMRSKALGASVRLVATASDTIEDLQHAIQESLDADILITSGGVSVGDKDFTKEAFKNLGMQTLIDGIHIKPGKPTNIGKIANTIVVNLAGNPLASMVNYELFVRAILRKMSGRKDYYHASIQSKIKDEYKVRAGKYAVILGKFDGKYFSPLRPQMPGMVSPMQEADGMILITPEIYALEKHQEVKVLPIKWEHTSEEKEKIFSYA